MTSPLPLVMATRQVRVEEEGNFMKVQALTNTDGTTALVMDAEATAFLRYCLTMVGTSELLSPADRVTCLSELRAPLNGTRSQPTFVRTPQ